MQYIKLVADNITLVFKNQGKSKVKVSVKQYNKLVADNIILVFKNQRISSRYLSNNTTSW